MDADERLPVEELFDDRESFVRDCDDVVVCCDGLFTLVVRLCVPLFAVVVLPLFRPE